MNRTDRLMAILLELQGRGVLRAEDIARRFEVSVRTVYRDMEALGENGVPIVAAPGTGYRLMEGYFLPPLSFTAAEAALLLLGGGFVRDRVDPELRQAADSALLKLASILPPERRDAVARRRDELLFAGPGAPPEDARLAALRRAIEQRRVLRLIYHTYRRATPEARDVEPVKLVYLGDVWHLAAYCRRRRASRLFRLDRIDRLELLPEEFTPTARHDVGPDSVESLQRFPEARIRFNAEAERWAREQRPYFFLREERDSQGAVFVYSLRDESAVLGWVLGWGATVESVAPPAFRLRLAREAAAVVARLAGLDPDRDRQESFATPATTVSGATP